MVRTITMPGFAVAMGPSTSNWMVAPDSRVTSRARLPKRAHSSINTHFGNPVGMVRRAAVAGRATKAGYAWDPWKRCFNSSNSTLRLLVVSVSVNRRCLICLFHTRMGGEQNCTCLVRGRQKEWP